MTPTSSFSRLLAPATAAAALAAAMLVLDIVLHISLAPHPSWLAAAISSTILDEFGSRIASVEQLRPDNRQLVAVLGISPVREGLDPKILAASDPLHRQWLLLGAEGRTFATLEVYSRFLTSSTLHPSLIVFGLSEAMVHRDDHAENIESSLKLLPSHLRHLQINHVLLDGSWLYRNRDALADTSTVLMVQAKRLVRALFALPMSATYPLEADPWSSQTSVFVPHSDAAHMALQWRGHQDLLVPSEFEGTDRQINALCSMIARARALGAEVVIVLMPETTRLRDLCPPIAHQRFQEALTAASAATAGHTLRVIDLRSAIPDGLFWDDAHLNPDGRRLLSTQLPTDLR